MDRESVESSMIKSLGYDTSRFLLEIEFTNGKVYQYLDVLPGVYDSLVESDSVGKSFIALIKKPGYEHRQL